MPKTGSIRTYESTIKEGDIFGNWTVLEHLERQETEKNRPKTEKRKQHRVLCRCTCGVEKSVIAELLVSGKSRSCGCINKMSEEDKERYRIKEQIRKKEYYQKNRESIIERRKNKPKTSKEKRFQYTIKHKYGITVEEYEAWYIVQRGRCYICDKPFVEGDTWRKICIDHNHKTGEMRSLLCKKCNLGLSFFDEDPDILTRAALYIKGEPSQ
jgi:hypothetical protein